MKTIMRIFVLACSCSLSFAASAAMTNSLTYAASFGKVSGGHSVTNCAVAGTVEMTVALYASQTATRALWCRRFAADVVDGSFAVVLSDDNGTDVSGTELPEVALFATLPDLFAKVEPASALWVGISNVRQDGVLLPEAATSVLTRGKVAGAPFAVVADRAERSLGSFTVRGTATVSVLETKGAMTVEDQVEFSSGVTFNRQAMFRDGGLVVTGLVSKATMDGVVAFEAESLTVSKTLSAGSVAVTGGTATTLKPASSGFVAPTTLAVSGTLATESGGTVKANACVAAEELEATADFTIPTSGVLEWPYEGTLSVPGGVYEADDANANLKGVYAQGDTPVKNESGKNALLTLATGASTGASTVRIGSDKEWACYGPVSSNSKVGVNLTTLTPLVPNDQVMATWVLTHSMKGLTK